MAKYEEALKTGLLKISNVDVTVGHNCHFNGMYVKGDKRVKSFPKLTIGTDFHSGKGCLIRLVDHDWRGNGLPYAGWTQSDCVIGDFVWFGDRVTVLKGVTIGDGAIIQYGSVVVSDIPPLAVAGGHPARVFAYRDEAEFNQKRDNIEKRRSGNSSIQEIKTTGIETGKTSGNEIDKETREEAVPVDSISYNHKMTEDEVRSAINPKIDPALFGEEYSKRKRFELHPFECYACRTNSHLQLLAYPDRKEWYFQNLTVICCSKCGFSFVPIKPYGLNEYYKYCYSDAKGRAYDEDPNIMFKDPVALRSMGLKRSNRHLKLIEKFNPDVETVIDFGCGYGLTLSMLEADIKLGVEVDSKMIRFAESQNILIHKDLSSISDDTADVLICSHVLEHIHVGDLKLLLYDMLRVTRPNGIALIEVPNAPLLRLNLSTVKHAPHLNFFTQQSLSLIFERYGWKVLRAEGAGEDRALSRRPIFNPSEADDIRGGALVVVLKAVKSIRQ